MFERGSLEHSFAKCVPLIYGATQPALASLQSKGITMRSEVVVVIGAGGIGTAIARRQGFGKHIILADYNEDLLKAAASELETAGYKVSCCKVDVSSRESV